MADAATRNRSEENRGDSDDTTPLQAIAAGAVTLITLGVAFSLMALGSPFFWVAFPVGFGGGMPLAIGLARWYESTHDGRHERSRKAENDTDAALEALRERYARGELDEDEFEARVERLLETESVADAEASVNRGTETDDVGERNAAESVVEDEQA
jgi:uncharacterized membrane protein